MCGSCDVTARKASTIAASDPGGTVAEVTERTWPVMLSKVTSSRLVRSVDG